MESKKVKLVLKLASKDWNGKELRKRTIVFEDDTNGELTLFPDNEEVEVGQVLEYTTEDRGYGLEIKLPRKSGGGGGGGFGGAKKTPAQEANLNAIAVTKSALEGDKLYPKDWKAFYVEAYNFFLSFANDPENSKPGVVDDLPWSDEVTELPITDNR
jgi:hypothetical protein